MSENDSKQIFADNLNYYLLINGVSQKEVSEKLGVASSTINEWCKGKKYPRIDKIEKLANYFGILKSDLIEVRPEEQPEHYYTLELDSDTYDAIGKYKGLSPAQKKAVKQMMETFLLG